MSVKRRDLIAYLAQNGFYLLREGKKHSIYTNGERTIPIKRHRTLDRVTANELCKQAGLRPIF
jgi:predicted RNA binding protein YcfA (HicA-like mRNA interferase family)